jgi:small subunit ribosomal protein S17
MNERRRLVGIVTSNKMTKTVVVEISRTFRHPLYKKVVHTSKNVKAQDELGCQVGDKVQIVETRPLSADKRWVVETIVKKQAVPDVPAIADVDIDVNVPADAKTDVSEGA